MMSLDEQLLILRKSDFSFFFLFWLFLFLSNKSMFNFSLQRHFPMVYFNFFEDLFIYSREIETERECACALTEVREGQEEGERET